MQTYTDSLAMGSAPPTTPSPCSPGHESPPLCLVRLSVAVIICVCDLPRIGLVSVGFVCAPRGLQALGERGLVEILFDVRDASVQVGLVEDLLERALMAASSAN